MSFMRLRQSELRRYISWFFVYLAISLFIYNDIIRTGLSSSIPNKTWGNGDWGLGAFLIAWTPFALIHHLNPFYSNYEFALHGINLMATPAYFTQAIILSPITLVFGAVTSMNVAIILAPVVCALPAAIVFYKITSYKFESVVGGLLCGFGRGLISGNTASHLNLSWIFGPPIFLYIFYHVLKHDKVNVIKTGIALGLVITLQFYAGTEVTVDAIYMCIIAGLVLLLINSKLIKEKFLKLLGVTFIAGVISSLLCSYALYVFLYGKGHVFVARYGFDSVLNYNLLFVFFPRNAGHNGVQIIGNGFSSVTISFIAVAVVLSRIHKLRKIQAAKVGLWMCLIVMLAMMGPLLQIWAGGPLQPNPVYYIVRHLPFISAVLYRRFVYYEELFLGFTLVYALGSFRRSRHVKDSAVTSIISLKSLLALLVLLNLLWNGSYVWNVQSKFAANPVLSSKTYLPQNAIIWVYPRAAITDGTTLIYLAQSGLRYKIVSVYANVLVDGQNSIMLPPSPLRNYVESNTKATVKPQPDIVNSVKYYVSSSHISCIVFYNANQYKDEITKVSYIYGSPKMVQDTAVWCNLVKK